MRIFYRYMALRFLKPFLFGLGIFAILIFLGDLFDKMPRLIRSHAAMGVILEYLWLEVPYWSVRVIPMATLLATLYAVAGFVQSGEWIAVQASGFEPRAFFRPVLWMALLVTLASFGAQESLLPACYGKAQRLWRDQIFPEWEWERFDNLMLAVGGGRFVTVKTFFVKDGLWVRPVLDYYGSQGTTRQIDAEEARWDAAASRWVFHNGVERSFEPGGRIREHAFTLFPSDVDATPRALIPRDKSPDEMSIIEMRGYIRKIQSQGGSLREVRAALQSKIAYPFANLILCALGIPIAVRFRRTNRAVSFAVALALSFGYLWLSEMGRALGSGGWLPPAASAWMTPLVFGALAIRLYRRPNSSV